MAEQETGVERMSDVEALMWYVEADPHLSSTFANITFLDRPPDLDRLRARMWRASRLVPRLRRRVIEGAGPANPTWADDPDFDLDRHLDRLALRPGATDADACQVAADLAATPLDRDRPLWSFVVLEGLADGRAAMVQRLHHTITDGEGGIKMSVEYVDLERDATGPEPLDDGPPPPAPHLRTPTTVDATGLGAPSPLAATVEVIEDLARRGVGAAGRLADAARDLTRDPAQLSAAITGLPAESAATLRSLVRQLAVLDRHRSPLWSERSLDRSLDTFDVPLDAVKHAAQALGGTVNDLFVAAAAGGAGAYHRARGHDVDDLRMSMPVSTRSSRADGLGGNSFTPTRVLVPTDADPRRRFAEVHERLEVTKSERANDFTGALAGLVTMLPRPLLLRVARQQVTTVDFTTSNVRAAPFDLYIAGALLEANYPLGPVAGTAWNLTTMSYRGQLNVGLHADTAAVVEPSELAGAIADAFTELVELGS